MFSFAPFGYASGHLHQGKRKRYREPSLYVKLIKKDDRFIYILKSKDSKKGASSSRNLGLIKAKGAYIQFLDSDDILANNKLEEQLKILRNQSEYAISTCRWGFFETETKPFKVFENNADFKKFENIKEYFDLIGQNGGFFPCHCFLLRKEMINKTGFWNENLSMNDDGEFFFRVLLNANKIIFCEETHVLYRIENGLNNNLSKLNSLAKADDLISSWKIIETLYIKKYNEIDSSYLNKKKGAVYNQLKNKYPNIINQNKVFFRKQIQEDNLMLKFKKLKKKILLKLFFFFKIIIKNA